MRVLAPLSLTCPCCGQHHSLAGGIDSLTLKDDGIPLVTARCPCARCGFKFTAMQVMGVQA